MGKKKPLTMDAVNRIKRATALKNGGLIPKDSFAATAESIVARRTTKKPLKKTNP